MAQEVIELGSCRTVASIAHLSDAQLIVAAQHGENAAIEALIRRYNKRLFRAARSILRDHASAEDAVQECYIQVFTHLHLYRPTGSFGAWLTRIAINEALMLKRRTRAMLSFEDLDDEIAQDEHALTAMDAAEEANARQLLEIAVDLLPEAFRTVFMLRVVEQLSTAETAECLGINEATVKTRLHRAQRRLRNTLSRRLRRQHLSLFEFGGRTCDRIVANVFGRLKNQRNASLPS